MLTHVIGILYLASVSFTDVPSRLYAVSHLKGIIDTLKDELMDFKKNMTLELTKLETEGENSNKNNAACLKQISQARNETRKLLNMLVEGEFNGFETVEESMENMSLNRLSTLWGALAPGGRSEQKLQNELDEYREKAKARVIDAIKSCKTPVAVVSSTTRRTMTLNTKT